MTIGSSADFAPRRAPRAYLDRLGEDFRSDGDARHGGVDFDDGIETGRGATFGGSEIRLVKSRDRKYSILRARTGGIPLRSNSRSPLAICISSSGIIHARRWSESEML